MNPIAFGEVLKSWRMLYCACGSLHQNPPQAFGHIYHSFLCSQYIRVCERVCVFLCVFVCLSVLLLSLFFVRIHDGRYIHR